MANLHPPVSKFKVETVAYARAAIFGPDTWEVLDSTGNYSAGVLDSTELDGKAARNAVTILLNGNHYENPYNFSGVLCHAPHFLLLAYDNQGRQTNRFTVCFTCGNVRMTNYRRFPKTDKLMMNTGGKPAFLALQDDLFLPTVAPSSGTQRAGIKVPTEATTSALPSHHGILRPRPKTSNPITKMAMGLLMPGRLTVFRN